MSNLAGSTAYFAPDERRYGALMPDTVADPALQDAVLRFREACATAGIGFRAWLVGLHHEGLAAQNPEAAAHGLDGSPLGHSLCPVGSRAIEYVAALAADVAARFAPETIDLEAWLYPAWEPSYTLTLALEPLDWRAQLLATQCFCEHCRRLLGPRADELQHRARRAAGAPFAAPGDDGATADEVIMELAAMRALGAARLVSAVAPAVHREGVELRVFGSGDPEQARLQGLSPAAVEEADSVLVGCARLSGAELSERFAGLSELVGPRRPTVSTNWTPDRTPAGNGRRRDPSRCRRRRWARPLQPLARTRGRARRVSRRRRRLPRSGGRLTMIIDAHVMIGASRDASLAVDDLLRTMDTLGIDHALDLATRRDASRSATARETSSWRGRRRAARAGCSRTPWRRRGSAPDAIEELERAREAGARALKLDPALQGFDILDGSVDPLVGFAVASGWPIYIRTGTPPHSLPLQVAWLASRFPDGRFVMGKSGATDFSHDGPAALAAAANVYADSSHVEWPTALAAGDPEGAGGRVVFTTDAPFTDAAVELARVTEAPLTETVRAAILGQTMRALLGL